MDTIPIGFLKIGMVKICPYTSDLFSFFEKDFGYKFPSMIRRMNHIPKEMFARR